MILKARYYPWESMVFLNSGVGLLLSLSLPSGASVMQMAVHFLLSLGSVKPSSFFNNSFPVFAVLFGESHAPSPGPLVWSSVS